MNYSEVRRRIYKFHKECCPYLVNWPWYSYRKYKAMLFTELASVLVFVLLPTSVTPNMVTVVYIFLNLFTGILLAAPLKAGVFLAVTLAFFKPSLDWGDGSLARLKNITSVSGDILDNYAATLSWVSFWAGIGIYLGNYTNPIFYYLSPVIPVLLAADVYVNARERFVHHYFSKKEFRGVKGRACASDPCDRLKKSVVGTVKNFIDKVFEHNTRTVDLVCLFILIEMFTPVRILWLFFSSFLLWQTLTFLIKFYMILSRNWAENELDNLRKMLYE